MKPLCNPCFHGRRFIRYYHRFLSLSFLAICIVAGAAQDNSASVDESTTTTNAALKDADDADGGIIAAGLYPYDTSSQQQQQHGQMIIDALVDAVAEASEPIHSAAGAAQQQQYANDNVLESDNDELEFSQEEGTKHQDEKNLKPGGIAGKKRTREGRLHKWMKRVQGLLPPILYGVDTTTPPTLVGGDKTLGSDAATQHNPENRRPPNAQEKQQQSPSPSKRRQKKAFEAFRFINKADMEETIAGARLLSGSFQILSSTAGFLANTVRVSGDTAAGIMGSSVKVVGTAVKSVGSGLVGASRFLEQNSSSSAAITGNPKASTSSEQSNKGQPATQQQRPALSSPPISWRQRQKKRYGTLGKHSRLVASKSVRLVGNVIGGVGESLLIVGVAAESLASSTAGVAEETVRIFEELASTISVAISLRGQRKHRIKHHTLSSDHASRHPSRRKLAPPYLSFGSYDQTSATPGETSATTLKETLHIRLMEAPSIKDAMELIDLLVSDAVSFGREVSADVEGVPSIAGELFAALLFCHLVAVLLLSTRRPKVTKEDIDGPHGRGTPPTPDSYANKLDFGCSLKWPSQMAGKTEEEQKPRRLFVQTCLYLVRRVFLFLFVLPFKVIRWSIQFLLGFVFNRNIVLFCIYCLVWIYLSRLSRQRTLQIQRRAEAIGFRNGGASASGVSLPAETTLWLNHILNSIWRVSSNDASGTSHEYSYPVFVSRAFRGSYGGLEPYISSAIGAGLVSNLELTKSIRPTDVAYISLFSLSLGRQAPVIRGVKLGSEIVQGDASRIELDLDVDAYLEDMSMVLEVKLSSLSYALLPSTKVNIHNLDFRASIKAVLLLDPKFPFVSKVELSMAKQPHCNIRITPVSKDSGLKGVDLGSIPFLNDWIQDAIRTGLSAYVAPRYVTVDLAELLHSEKLEISSIAGPINIENLRRKTRFAVSEPRTSTPEGIAITSVADKLESHQTSTQAVGGGSTYNDGNSLMGSQDFKKKRSVLRPVTELSRLALNMHALKEENLVRPVTELARLGLDRWLGSTILATRHEEAN